jgi:hypothetical protein
LAAWAPVSGADSALWFPDGLLFSRGLALVDAVETRRQSSLDVGAQWCCINPGQFCGDCDIKGDHHNGLPTDRCSMLLGRGGGSPFIESSCHDSSAERCSNT